MMWRLQGWYLLSDSDITNEANETVAHHIQALAPLIWATVLELTMTFCDHWSSRPSCTPWQPLFWQVAFTCRPVASDIWLVFRACGRSLWRRVPRSVRKTARLLWRHIRVVLSLGRKMLSMLNESELYECMNDEVSSMTMPWRIVEVLIYAFMLVISM